MIVDDPLLVSVRSGAPRSMPGMMDTILNLGLNEETEAGLARASGDAAFAADCLRRFREQYASVVGSAAPSDPWDQLRGAIEAVFRSWLSERARAYRQAEGIPDDLGTGVTVQAMVFGNRGADSGTGVLFTRNPATGEAELYGDVLFDAQGEDVVAGTHATEPVSGLAARMPAMYDELQAARCDARAPLPRLLRHRVHDRGRAAVAAPDPGGQADAAGGAPDGGRDGRGSGVPAVARGGGPAGAAAPGVAAAWSRWPGRIDPRRSPSGLGASPGVASGEIRLTPAGAADAAAAGRDVILVRAETSPDDVDRHAREPRGADVARRVREPRRRRGARVGDPGGGRGGRRRDRRRVRDDRRAAPRRGRGDLDRRGDGRGVRRRRRRRDRGRAGGGVLLGWARELGIDVDGEAHAAPASADHAAATRDDALRALLIKGYGDGTGLAPAIGSSPDDATRLIDRAGRRRARGAGRRLVPAHARAVARRRRRCSTADREAWGSAAAEAALDAFLALDARMKSIVTDWQMRDAQTVNDHSDAAYDAAVLARLAELHADVEAWLSPLVAGLPRLARYGARLGAAAEAAAAGNGKFVASPRVDSYHGAWFELHEDLIRLAGRTRESETAAGRA